VRNDVSNVDVCYLLI